MAGVAARSSSKCWLNIFIWHSVTIGYTLHSHSHRPNYMETSIFIIESHTHHSVLAVCLTQTRLYEGDIHRSSLLGSSTSRPFNNLYQSVSSSTLDFLTVFTSVYSLCKERGLMDANTGNYWSGVNFIYDTQERDPTPSNPLAMNIQIVEFIVHKFYSYLTFSTVSNVYLRSRT